MSNNTKLYNYCEIYTALNFILPEVGDPQKRALGRLSTNPSTRTKEKSRNTLSTRDSDNLRLCHQSQPAI